MRRTGRGRRRGEEEEEEEKEEEEEEKDEGKVTTKNTHPLPPIDRCKNPFALYIQNLTPRQIVAYR